MILSYFWLWSPEAKLKFLPLGMAKYYIFGNDVGKEAHCVLLMWLCIDTNFTKGNVIIYITSLSLNFGHKYTSGIYSK